MTSTICRPVLALSLLSGLLLAAHSHGKALYRYTDPQGNSHYSGLPPADNTTAQRLQLTPDQPTPDVLIRQQQGENDSLLVADNTRYGPVQLIVEAVQMENISSVPMLPLSRLLAAHQMAIPVLRFRLRNPLLPGHFRYQSRSIPGDPNARPDLHHAYHMPFAAGHSYRVSQGFNGDFSHHTPDSRYAIDIAMPEHSAIHAARAGVIMSIRQDFTEHGIDARHQQRANLIRILHADGSMALYAHLAPDSALVLAGQTVRSGQQIAASGNTGYSSGPHLHFVIQANRQGQLLALPLVFADPAGTPITPRTGMLLQQPDIP